VAADDADGRDRDVGGVVVVRGARLVLGAVIAIGAAVASACSLIAGVESVGVVDAAAPDASASTAFVGTWTITASDATQSCGTEPVIPVPFGGTVVFSLGQSDALTSETVITTADGGMPLVCKQVWTVSGAVATIAPDTKCDITTSDGLTQMMTFPSLTAMLVDPTHLELTITEEDVVTEQQMTMTCTIQGTISAQLTP
jgi:hypothetical protein